MRKPLASALALLAMSPVLFAHPGHGEVGFAAGATHPVHGLDHLLAMVAVGLMSVRCAMAPGASKHALWQGPATFMAMMVVGGLVALTGLPLPGVEWGIALSVLVFGVIVALGSAPRTSVACLVVGAFALLHGHAHVAEMSGNSLASYMGGFLLTTAVLHAVGIAGGWYIAKSANSFAIRGAGAAVALASLSLFVGLITG